MLKSTNKLIIGLDERYQQFWDDNTEHRLQISNGNTDDWCEATQVSTQENLKGLLHHIKAARVLLMAMDSEHDQFHNSHEHLHERDYEYGPSRNIYLPRVYVLEVAYISGIFN